MTNDTVALRDQIARTRYEMAQTIERIDTRLDPEALKEQAKARALELTEQAKTAAYDATIGKAKTMVSKTSNGIADTIKANPVPLALTALGIGWLVVNARAPQARQRVVHALGDKTDDIKLRGQQIESMAVQRFNDNPLVVGLGVAAVGLLIGLAVPTSQKENELLGATRDRLAHQAIGKVDELAHQAIDKTKEQLDVAHQNEPAQEQT
jgi:hypothetical protein